MKWNGKDGDYNPAQMLDYCKVDGFRFSDKANHYVTEILANLVVVNDAEELKIKLTEIVVAISRSVSIGMALEKLNSVATTGPELDHGRTGVDALTYHLGGSTVDKAIEALQAVKAAWAADEAARREDERRFLYAKSIFS